MSIRSAVAKRAREVTQNIKSSSKDEDQQSSQLKTLKSCVNKIINLPASMIVMKENVRHEVDEKSDDFRKLCESIQTFGLMKNIVAELKVAPDQSFELVCVSGHRRLTALKILDYQEKIPVLIKEYEKSQRIGAALSENVNRKDLSVVDLANGYVSLKKHGWNDDDLVKHFEKDKKTISRYVRLGELPDDIKKLVQENSSLLNARTMFNEILPGAKAPNEVRKAIKRKLEKLPPVKGSAGQAKQKKLKSKIEEFFKERKLTQKQKELLLEAFHFTGVLR